ncbi:hypothetical protein ABW19_dt0203867 [Dactylella cylindrospora]|nr:hypothetical protein ABW19_dt0203867 [Dactylella cylindrospora]
MSGSATLRQSKTEVQQEAVYTDVVNALGLQERSLEEKQVTLQSLAAADIMAKLPPLIHVGPSIEPGFLDYVVNLSTIAEKTTPAWCKELVIGDCFHDASCFKTRVLSHPNNAAYFITCINATLPPSQAEAIIKVYNLSPHDPAEKSLVDCMELLTDLRWYLPVLHTVIDNKTSTKISRYHFHQINKFDSQWNGLAAHLFDITLLLHNHTHFLRSDEIQLGEDMAKRFLSFAYGEGFVSEEEESAVSGSKVVVWGPNGETKIMQDQEYDEIMRKGRGKLLRSLGWESCEKLANAIQFGIGK